MSATARLYELADLRQVIDLALEETQGELTPDIAAALDAWEAAFPQKVESVALYIADIEGDAAKIKAEEERLAAKRTALLNRAKGLEQYLQANLERAGVQKVSGVLKTVALQKNPPKVVPLVDVTQEDLRHWHLDGYATVTPETYTMDKKAILAAHKANDLPGHIAKLVTIQQTTGLRIR